MQQTDAEIACVQVGERLHPVYALLRQDLHAALADYINQGGRAVQRWFISRQLVQVDFSDCPERFVNINTAEELQVVAGRIRPPSD